MMVLAVLIAVFLYVAYGKLSGWNEPQPMAFQGPDEFVAGAEAAFFSLPELFFVNFRKGSLDYGPSDVARTRMELNAASH